MMMSRFDSEAFCGYTQITTFWDDFSIAENFGKGAIVDTFNRAFEEWKGNYKYLTELVMIMNWKIWQWHGKNNEFAKVYNDLWEQADKYACENLKDEELSYFYRTTD